MLPMTRSRIGDDRRRGQDRADRQRRQHDIEREHFAHHARYRKSVIGGALVEMAAMRRPERLAPCHPAATA